MEYHYLIASPEANFCVKAVSHEGAAKRAARIVFGRAALLFISRYSGADDGNGFFMCFRYLVGAAVPQFTWKFHVSR